MACAEAGVTLISPFVGRIYDYHRKARGSEIPVDEDPGVESVRRIYAYFKKHGYATQVMGASFRRIEQIQRLAGCDLLTISPELLAELAATEGELTPALTPEMAAREGEARIHLDESGFRRMHNQDPMAVEKLSEGIRKFDEDARALEAWAATVAADAYRVATVAQARLARPARQSGRELLQCRTLDPGAGGFRTSLAAQGG